MNYNGEPGRPIYTQQHAISSLKAYLAFKRTQCKYSRFNLYVSVCGGRGEGEKGIMTLNLKNRLLIMHILPGDLPDNSTFRHVSAKL